MKKRLQYIDGVSDKFWQIEVKGNDHIVTYGRNGTAGVSQIKNFETEELCLKSATKLIAEKEKKGYSESGEVNIETLVNIKSTSGKSIKVDIKVLTDEIDAIIKQRKVNDIIPFLNSNLKGNKEAIKKHIRKAKKYWTDYVDLSNDPEFRNKKESYNWGSRADNIQSKIVFYFCFATFNKDEFRTIDRLVFYLNEFKEDDILNQLFENYKPESLSDILVALSRTSNWWVVKYDVLLDLESKKYIEFNPELFAYSLCCFTNSSHGIKKSDIDCLQFIKNSKTTIERDIPELFNYETNIANMRDWGTSDDKVNRHWKNYFRDLVNEKLISKDLIIENCILIQTKEWNNGVKSFFKNILLEFELTSDELVNFQDRIFALLHNSYFPIVNFGIDLIKIIHTHDKFNLDAFIEYVEPVMMRADCKGGIKKLISMLEKLSKTNRKLNPQLGLILADVILISDMDLQERATKLILKIGDKKEYNLREKLSNYQLQMLGNIKNVLSEYIDTNIENEIEENEPNLSGIKKTILEKRLSIEVVLPKDKTEMLFHYGKWIASNEIIDSEIIVNSFITQGYLYDKEFKEQFQPYEVNFKNNYLGSTNKYFLGNFILNKIVNLKQEFKVNFDHVEAKTLKLAYHIYYLAHQKILANSTLPLLSMPTHYPFWIEPKILIQRLIDYDHNNEKVDNTDFAIAISRMPRENIEEAKPLIQNLNSKYKKLIEFCLGISDQIEFNFHSVIDKLFGAIRQTNDKLDISILWAVAASTYYPDSTFDVFQSTAIDNIPMVGKPYVSNIKFVEKKNSYIDHTTKKEIIYNIWNQIHIEFPSINYIPSPLIYSQDLNFVKQNGYYYYTSLTDGDIQFWLSINSQNTNSIALWLLKHSCKIADGAKSDVKAFIESMMQSHFHHSHYSTLLLAASFFMEKKEIRMTASEVLYQLIENQRLDIPHFSESIALFAKNRYGVFQRFSESIISIKDTSPKHNLVLFQILNHVVANFKQVSKLPPNFKKLVESLLDLKIKTKQNLSSEAIIFLESYKENASMKKTIQQLLN